MTHSRTWRQFRAGMIVADAAVIVLTYILADILRCSLWMQLEFPEQWPELLWVGPPDGHISTVRLHMRILTFLPVGWPLILYWLGWYEQRWRSWQWHVRNVSAATAILGLSMAGLALLFARDLYPRAQIGFLCALTPATALLVRGSMGWIGRWIGSRQPRHVLIVGTGRNAVRLRRLLRSVTLGKPIVLGHLRGPWEKDAARTETGAIIGEITELGPILDRQVVDEVFFTAPVAAMADVLQHVQLCEEVGVRAYLQAESMACHSVPEIVDFHGMSLLAYSPERHSPELLSVKRLIDIALAIIGICVAAPIMVMCAILIRLTSPGPLLFRQRRSGLNGREFRMFKFRTMEPDAEAKKDAVAHLNEVEGPVFKIRNDPRVTRIGRLLRRWSLDELPQLFNVLLGDMSIVGPRPPIPAEVENYDRWQRRRLSMRPGLTCLWQIKGRHRIGFEEWMELDLFYIDHWSLKLDFLIMCRTVSVVVAGTGA